jgi:LysM repeat protein
MTSDTKIGLLLGLIFIFVIAFLINGLPSLKASAHGNELTYNMVNYKAETPRLANKEREVGYSLETRGRSSERATRVVHYDSSLPSIGDNPAEVRFSMPLPTYGPEVSNSAGEVLVMNQLSGGDRSRKNPQAVPEFSTVISGDNLAKSAQKLYGFTVGNKLATIDTLFAANKAVLTARDKVPAGIKLRIPLVKGTTKQTVMSPNPASASAAKRTGDRATTTVIYTVKDGDNLWKIAAKQLGDGSRNTDIMNLNEMVLLGSIDLKPGMRLKLPAQ